MNTIHHYTLLSPLFTVDCLTAYYQLTPAPHQTVLLLSAAAELLHAYCC